MAEFILRLRADSTGIKDLAGNTLSITGVDYSSAGKFSGGRALYFNGDNSTKLDYYPIAGISEGQDFTVSFWYKVAEADLPDGASVIGKQMADYSNIDFAVWYLAPPSRPDNSAEVFIGGERKMVVTTAILSKSDMFSSTTWKHCALTRRNNIVRFFINGIKYGEVVDNSLIFNDLSSTPIRFMRFSDSRSDRNPIKGYLDDVCIIKGKALWTEDFTPPTGYLKLSSYAYLSSNSLYTGASLTNLANNWSGLTSTEKEALVPSFSVEIPSIQDLASISPFRVLTDDTSLSNVKVTGQPKPQTIEPTSLINTGAVSTVQSINITNIITNVTVKFAITTDLTTYKVYDATEGEWVISTNIEEDGMSIAQINALTPEILALLDVSNGIAFKQCFIATSENALAELSEISAVVDIDGSWSQSVHGTDYNVAYPNKTTMSVTLKTNGDFIINYPMSKN